MNQRPIILVGGGTGGHIFPLVAVGEELHKRNIPFIYFGTNKGPEQKIIADLHWPFQAILAGKWRRYGGLNSALLNLIDSIKSLIGILQTIYLMIKFRPRAVISKGGFVALPVVLAARLFNRRIIVHESDAVMGLTNRLSSKLSSRVLTAFAVEVYPKADSRYRRVGLPVRNFFSQASKLRAPKKTRPLLFVLGGIQGANFLNRLVKANLAELLELTDVVHITGERDYQEYRSLAEKFQFTDSGSYRCFSFIDRELAYYYQSADLVVSRAGATTVAEGALFKKAMYLIPLPTSAGKHQLINAQSLAKEGCAVLSEQAKLTDSIFLNRVKRLINDPTELTKLGENLYNYFHVEDSAKLVVKEALNE